MHAHPAMSCPSETTLGHLVDGTLPTDARRSALSHLDACETCRALVGAIGASGSPAVVSGDEPRPEPVFPPGSLFGRYVVRERIGAGGMGVVYAAYDPVLDRRVAIKILRAAGASARERLLREGKAMARLSSPHVVGVLDVGAEGDRDFVAMELIEGTTLTQWLADAPRPWRSVLDALIDAGRGLAAAHHEGLVHRDFKPDNVLVSRAGRVAVTDFGLARVAEERAERAATGAQNVPPSASASAPHTRGVVGTPAYMAPEQLAGQPADAKSDQFAYCVTCFESLAGVRPFGAANLDELEQQVRAGRTAKPRRRFPAGLVRILERGLALDSARRFESMDTLLAALERQRLRSRQRRAGLLLAAVAAAGLAVGGVVHGAARPVALCKAADGEWAAVWGEGRRAQVQRAFSASGVSYAQDAWRGVDEAMSAYGAAWRAMETETCERTRVRGEQSDELMGLRMECLGDALRGAGSLADLLSTADGATVERGVVAVQRLPPVSACADERALRAPLRPPRDPAVAARVSELREREARLEALHAAGRDAQVVELGGPLASEAEEIGYLPLRAEVLEILGEAQLGAGDYGAAERTLKQSIFAAEGADHPIAQIGAWTQLVNLYGVSQTRFAEAHDAADHARALLGRVSDAGLLGARLDDALGQTWKEEGSYEKARIALLASLDARTRLAPESADRGVTLKALGEVLQQLGDLSAATETYERALSLLERVLGPSHPRTAAALKNVGTAYFLRGQSAEALARYRQAFAIQRQVLGPEHPDTLSTQGRVGAALVQQGDLDEAIAVYRSIVASTERQLGPDCANLWAPLENMGVALEGKGQLAEAESTLRRGLDIAVVHYGQQHTNVESALLNLADVLREEGKLPSAVELFRRAVSVSEAVFGPNHPHTGEDLGGLAFALLQQHRPAEALPVLERAVHIADSAEVDPANAAKIHFALARALWETGGDRRRARELATAALAALRASGARQAPDVAEAEQWMRAHGVDPG